VAFRESVFCPSELPESSPLGGLVGGLRPPRVVEATTPNGCCVVRVRATPLPGKVAGALDDRPELLRRVLVDGEGRPTGQSGTVLALGKGCKRARRLGTRDGRGSGCFPTRTIRITRTTYTTCK
jgi:hypothetical protein